MWARTSRLKEQRGETLSAVVQLGLILAILVVGGRMNEGKAQRSVQFETHVSTDSVAIGERFIVSLVAERGRDTDVSFPAPDAGSAIFGALEVIRKRAVQERRHRARRRVDSVAYEVTTFALDSVRVPALPVQVTAAEDTTIQSAPPRTVTVVSLVGADAKGIHGIAPIASFPQPWWAWALLVLTGTGLLAGVLYLWWRRDEEADTRSRPSHSEDAQTPYEATTSWIRQLEESYDLSDPDAVKPFYIELSNALRVYLAHELDVAALERTTREVVEILEHRPDVPTKAVTRVQAVLQLSDLVKFADVHPSTDDHEKALREARTALDAIEAAPRPQAERPSTAGASRSSRQDPIDGVASAA